MQLDVFRLRSLSGKNLNLFTWSGKPIRFLTQLCLHVVTNEHDCIFCDISTKKLNSWVIRETTRAMAFLDTSPLASGHSLVIPKSHYSDIFEVPDSVLGEVVALAKKISFALMKAGLAEGINLFSANREVADQSVFHFHVHVIPRNEGDKLSAKTWWRSVNSDQSELAMVLERIKPALIG